MLKMNKAPFNEQKLNLVFATYGNNSLISIIIMEGERVTRES